MRYFTTITFLLLAIALVHCNIKETIEEKAKEKLNFHKKHMPEKVHETAEDIQSGFDHVKGAVDDGLHAVKEDGITHKAKHAYEAVKDGLKITKDAKDVTVDTQKVGLEGVKDSAKEGVHIYRKHEDTKAKIEDVKQFGQDEIDESKEAFKEGLHGSLKDKTILVAETVASGLKGVEETIKARVSSGDKDGDKGVGEKIKEAVGLEDAHEKSVGEKIKEAVGLGDAHEKSVGEKIKEAVGLGDDTDKKEKGVGERIKEAVGLGDDSEKKQSIGEKIIKEAVGLGDDTDKKKKSVGEKIKEAVGLEDAHEKSVGEKIKDAVGLGDNSDDKKREKNDKHKKHNRDIDL